MSKPKAYVKPEVPDINLKENVKYEMQRTINDLKFNFGRTDEESLKIVATILCNLLKQMQIDADELTFLEFFSKYIHNAEVLKFSDFTNSQLIAIINETPLSDEDKLIAKKMYIDRKTYSDIADECGIGDERTIGNNKDRISHMLKLTAMRLYKMKG